MFTRLLYSLASSSSDAPCVTQNVTWMSDDTHSVCHTECHMERQMTSSVCHTELVLHGDERITNHNRHPTGNKCHVCPQRDLLPP